MAYQAIYRKWRPTTFEDVVGQEHITDTLKTEIKTNRLAHAYLFCGTRGTGKTTTAKILSRAVNCESPLPNGNPCNECQSCKGILAGTVMDISEIDAASNNGVENIRELRDEISYTPANVKYKIYIIDEVHMLSTSAFNALLKTLEEPPAHAIFILATTEPQKIPATIQSRCQRFDFKRISAKNIAGRIGEITRKDGINITKEAIDLVAYLGDGSMRDALSILDLCAGIEGEITREDIENVTGCVSRKALLSLSEAVIKGDISASLKLLNTIINAGKEINNLIDELIMCIREILICKILDDPLAILDKSREDALDYKKLGEDAPKEVLIYIIKTLSETASLCKTSTNPRVMLESWAVKVCDPSADSSGEAFGARLGKLEAIIATGNLPKAQPDVTKAEPIIEEVKEEAIDDAPPFLLDEQPDEEYVSEADDFLEEEVLPIPPMAEEPFDIPADKEPEQPAETGDREIDIISMQETLSKLNPAMASMLKMCKVKVRDGIYYVIAEDIIKATLSRDKDFTESLKGILNCNSLKYVTQSEYDGTDKTDPLDDIIKMAEDVGQITLF